MSMKPVRGIILAADRDLVLVAQKEAPTVSEVGQLHLDEGNNLLFHGQTSDEEPNNRSVLLLHGDPEGKGINNMEPEDSEFLRQSGTYRHVHFLEGNSAPLAARLICLLSRHIRLTVDNDYGVILSGEAFCELNLEHQARFVIGADPFYKL